MRRILAAIMRILHAAKVGAGWLWDEVFEPTAHAVDDVCSTIGRGVVRAADVVIDTVLAMPRAIFGGGGNGDGVSAEAAAAQQEARKRASSVASENKRALEVSDVAKQVVRCARLRAKGHDISGIAAEVPGGMGVAVRRLTEAECGRLGDLDVRVICQWMAGDRFLEGVRAVRDILNMPGAPANPSKSAEPARTADEQAIMSTLAARLVARGHQLREADNNEGCAAVVR